MSPTGYSPGSSFFTPLRRENMIADQIRFLGRLIARPSQVGAVAPSSPGLARAMAAQIDPSRGGPILELGPGTGVVTAALIARGILPNRITSIEYDPDFAKLVAERFPGVRVIRGDAYDLRGTLGDNSAAPFAAIVSSLPLLNEAPERRQKLIETAFELVAPGAPIVQFSYGLHSPVPSSETVSVTRAALVLFNLPPARVWVYRRK
jgi:phosphatidylethanolamine/phosphatidyl-N-methylethanolamine N-methyltransferase